MEVAFYHDDPNSLNYEQQSSPSSVGSASSTDIGVVSAIGPPNAGGYLNKEVMLKSMSLDLGPHLNEKTPMGHITENSVISRNRNVNSSSAGPINGNNGQGFPHQGVITSAYGALNASNVLTSPDVNMLKLSSPDLERMLIPNNNGQYMYPKSVNQTSVTQEQENYAEGFFHELERLKSAAHGGSNPDISSPAMSGVMGNESLQCSVITTGQSIGMSNQQQYTMPEAYYPHNQATTTAGGMHMGPNTIGGTIHHTGVMPQNRDILRLKEEPPQTVPEMSQTPPHSPIDMQHQEIIKSERKRQRNRIAASKCRKRKLERISRLEDKVKQLKSHNMELTTNANVLRQQVADLKSKVMAHVNSGCKLMMSQQHQANF